MQSKILRFIQKNHKIYIFTWEKIQAWHGGIFIFVQSGFKLELYHNVWRYIGIFNNQIVCPTLMKQGCLFWKKFLISMNLIYIIWHKSFHHLSILFSTDFGINYISFFLHFLYIVLKQNNYIKLKMSLSLN